MQQRLVHATVGGGFILPARRMDREETRLEREEREAEKSEVERVQNEIESIKRRIRELQKDPRHTLIFNSFDLAFFSLPLLSSLVCDPRWIVLL